jgi:hypothetical protein
MPNSAPEHTVKPHSPEPRTDRIDVRERVQETDSTSTVVCEVQPAVLNELPSRLPSYTFRQSASALGDLLKLADGRNIAVLLGNPCGLALLCCALYLSEARGLIGAWTGAHPDSLSRSIVASPKPLTSGV